MLDLDTLKPNTTCLSRDGREWEYIGKKITGSPTFRYIFYNIEIGHISTNLYGNVFGESRVDGRDIVSIKPSAPPENYVNVCGTCGTRGNAVHAPGCHYFRSSSELAAKREFMAQKAKELREMSKSTNLYSGDIQELATILAEVVERL